MVEGKLAFVQNRAHGTSSRYNPTTTNHHGQRFSIGKLAVAIFPRYFAMFYFKIDHMTQTQGIS